MNEAQHLNFEALSSLSLAALPNRVSSNSSTREHAADIRRRQTPQPTLKRDYVDMTLNAEARPSRQDLLNSLRLSHAHYAYPSLEALGAVLPKDFFWIIVCRRHLKHGYTAAAFLEFTNVTTSTGADIPLLELQFHLEIDHDESPGLAQRLFNVYVKAPAASRWLIFPSGLDVIPSLCFVLSRGQFHAVTR